MRSRMDSDTFSEATPGQTVQCCETVAGENWEVS